MHDHYIDLDFRSCFRHMLKLILPKSAVDEFEIYRKMTILMISLLFQGIYINVKIEKKIYSKSHFSHLGQLEDIQNVKFINP